LKLAEDRFVCDSALNNDGGIGEMVILKPGLFRKDHEPWMQGSDSLYNTRSMMPYRNASHIMTDIVHLLNELVPIVVRISGHEPIAAAMTPTPSENRFGMSATISELRVGGGHKSTKDGALKSEFGTAIFQNHINLASFLKQNEDTNPRHPGGFCDWLWLHRTLSWLWASS
jgi:hypothetical protein